MNRSKIEWCDYTWNPVTGCLHNCSYCYAKRIATRFAGGKAFPNGFEPTCWLSKRINEPMHVIKPSKIFVCSMGDLFGDWPWKVPWNGRYVLGTGVIKMVLKVAEKCPQHTFIFLTKNPRGMQGFEFPGNCWCGVSVEDKSKLYRVDELLEVNAKVKFVSLEPLLGEVFLGEYLRSIPFCRFIDTDDGTCTNNRNCDPECHMGKGCPETEKYRGIGWVIVGALTGPGAKLPPTGRVQNAIDQCRAAVVPVFLKDNLKWPEKIQEFPEV